MAVFCQLGRPLPPHRVSSFRSTLDPCAFLQIRLVGGITF